MTDSIDLVDHKIFQTIFKAAEAIYTFSDDTGFVENKKKFENLKLYVSFGISDKIYEANIYCPKSFRIMLVYKRRCYEHDDDEPIGYLDVGPIHGIMPYLENEYDLVIKKYKYYNDENFLDVITRVMLTYA